MINRRCHSVDEVAKWIKEVHEKVNNKDQSTGSTKSTYPEITANAALVLIIVACSLLDRQLAAQAEAFEKEGGLPNASIKGEFRLGGDNEHLDRNYPRTNRSRLV